jgi:hypothetical protein
MPDDALGGIFNSTINDSIHVALEDQPLLDPKLANSFKQLRQSMIETFEPNKLNSQTQFKAVVLLQLDNVTISSKEHVRVIARIPEVHTFLPVPAAADDFPRISCYPTFYAPVDKLDGMATPQGGIRVGSEVEVTFKNMKSFSGPTLLKVTRDGPPGDTAVAQESMTATPQAPAAQPDKPLTQAEADAQVAAVDPPHPGFIGIADASDSLAASGVAPSSPYFLGQTSQKAGQNWFRKDIIPHFVKLYKEVKARGGVFTTAGIGRSSTARNPQGPGEGFFSFHHLGRAIDLNMASAPFHSTRAKKTGAAAPYVYKDRTWADKMPFIITVDENEENRWHTWCQVINPRIAAEWTKATQAEGAWKDAAEAIQLLKADHAWDLPGACKVQATLKGPKKAWCKEGYNMLDTKPVAVQEPTEQPWEGATVGMGAAAKPRPSLDEFNDDDWLADDVYAEFLKTEKGVSSKQKKKNVAEHQAKMAKMKSEGQLNYWDKLSGGAWDAPVDITDIGWRKLDVIVPRTGAGGVMSFTTIEQRVLCFSFTALAKENGFDSIPPGKGSRGKTGNVRKLAAGEQFMHYRKTEWWHFQNNMPSVIPDMKDPDKKTVKPLTGGKTVYAEELCLVLGSWEKVKEKWARMCVWHVPSIKDISGKPLTGQTMVQLYDLFGPGTRNTTRLSANKLFWSTTPWSKRNSLLRAKLGELTGHKNALVLGKPPKAKKEKAKEGTMPDSNEQRT